MHDDGAADLTLAAVFDDPSTTPVSPLLPNAKRLPTQSVPYRYPERRALCYTDPVFAHVQRITVICAGEACRRTQNV